MTTAFKGSQKFDGICGDHARVADYYDCVMIHAIDPLAKEDATIGMTPDQARLFAAGIIEAADRAKTKQ